MILLVFALASAMHFCLSSGDKDLSHDVVLLFVHNIRASWEISLAAGFKCNSKSNTPKSLSDAMLVSGTLAAWANSSGEGVAYFPPGS